MYSKADQLYQQDFDIPKVPKYNSIRSEEIKTNFIWEERREKFPDIVGWISGAGMDYPVVQGSDNEYYLKHLADKTYNSVGAVFLDFRNSSDLSDKISVIYGHNVRDNRMFGALWQYSRQDFYEENPYIYYENEETDIENAEVSQNTSEETDIKSAENL